MKQRIKLSKWAKLNDVSWRTVYRYWKSGKLTGIQLSTGTILVDLDDNESSDFTVVYARVSNSSRRDTDLISDFVSVITSMCARIYGQRRGKRKTEKITQELKNETY